MAVLREWLASYWNRAVLLLPLGVALLTGGTVDWAGGPALVIGAGAGAATAGVLHYLIGLQYWRQEE